MEVYEVYGSVRDIRDGALLYFNKVVGYVTALSQELAAVKARESEKIFADFLKEHQSLHIDYVQEMSSEKIKQKLIDDVI